MYPTHSKAGWSLTPHIPQEFPVGTCLHRTGYKSGTSFQRGWDFTAYTGTCVYIYKYIYMYSHTQNKLQLWALFWKKIWIEAVIVVTILFLLLTLQPELNTAFSFFIIRNYFLNYIHPLNAHFLGMSKTLPTSFKLINLHPTDPHWVTARISWYSGTAAICLEECPPRNRLVQIRLKSSSCEISSNAALTYAGPWERSL